MRTQAALAIAVGLLAAAGSGWWLGRAGRGDGVVAGHELAAAGPDVAAAAMPLQRSPSEPKPRATVPVSAVTGNAPLPTLGTPLRLSLAELQRRADAGEPKAACRLAAEWSYCNTMRQRLEATERSLDPRSIQAMLERAPPAGRERIRAEWTQRMSAMRSQAETLLAESAHCDGVPEASPQQIASRWRQSALGGNVAAMRQYATGNAFRTSQVLQVLPSLMLYRNEAEAIARRAADAGDFSSALALAAAYSPQGGGGFHTFLRQTVKPDGVEALALYLRARDSVPADDERNSTERRRLLDLIDQLDARLTVEQRDQARRKAAQRPPLRLPDGGLSMGMVLGGTEDIERGDCDGSGPLRLKVVLPGA